MKHILLIVTCALVATNTTAQAPRTACDKSTQEQLVARASQGSAKAQFTHGLQLSLGECGREDPVGGLNMLLKSAQQDYPPALHMAGVILRREGRLTDAMGYFYAAAKKGVRLAEVDLGLMHADKATQVFNAPMAYAWLSTSLTRERPESLQKFLQKQLDLLTNSMSAEQKRKGEELRAKTVEQFEKIPEFKDTDFKDILESK